MRAAGNSRVRPVAVEVLSDEWSSGVRVGCVERRGIGA
jgi:hypothetical protein